MIKDVQFWREWEDELLRATPADLERSLKIVDGMIEEARLLGIWPPSDPMEGIDVKIKIAKAVNSV